MNHVRLICMAQRVIGVIIFSLLPVWLIFMLGFCAIWLPTLLFYPIAGLGIWILTLSICISVIAIRTEKTTAPTSADDSHPALTPAPEREKHDVRHISIDMKKRLIIAASVLIFCAVIGFICGIVEANKNIRECAGAYPDPSQYRQEIALFELAWGAALGAVLGVGSFLLLVRVPKKDTMRKK